jgi:hypothetical protein
MEASFSTSEASLEAVDRLNAGGGLAMTDSTWRLRRS